MNFKSFTGAVSLAALIGGTVIGPANAQIIFLGLQSAGVAGDGSVVGAIKTVASGSPTGVGAIALNFGVFNFISGSANGETNDPTGFASVVQASVGAKQGAAHTLNVYFTEQGLTGNIAPQLFTGGLTSNGLSDGWSVTETIYVDPANGKFTTVNPIATYSFSPSSAASYNFTKYEFGLDIYSVTERYTITSPGGSKSKGSANLTEVVSTSVPEVSTWAMMMAGFAGLGLVGFGRNKKARAIEA